MGRAGPDGIMGGLGGSQEAEKVDGVRLSGFVALEEFEGSGTRLGMRKIDGRDLVHLNDLSLELEAYGERTYDGKE